MSSKNSERSDRRKKLEKPSPKPTKAALFDIGRSPGGLGLDRIEAEPISEEIFDTGVNMGRGTAVRIVQKSVNFLEIGNPLLEDGLIGPKTFERVYYWGRKDPEAFHKALNGFQFMRYVEIVGRNVPLQAPSWVKGAQYETKLPCREEPRPVAGELPNPTQEKFARGWMKRIQYYRSLQ